MRTAVGTPGGPSEAPGAATWHDPSRDGATRQKVMHAVYTLFARRKPEMAAQFQQNKLPDFIRRLEESLYRMASSLEEYADLNTLEQRLQQVVKHIVRKPGGSQGHGGSHGEVDGGGAGTSTSPPSSQLRQQAQMLAAFQQPQQQPQQLQQQPQANGAAMEWQLEGGLGVPQSHQQPPAAQQQQPQQQQVVVVGGGNGMAVAGAPAGQSTAESAQRGGVSGGLDLSALAVGGGDVTSALTRPPSQAGPPPSMSTGLGGLTPTYMANGAPVLLRNGGGGASVSPSYMGGLVPSGPGGSLGGGLGGGLGGMMPLGGTAGAGGMIPSAQPGLGQLGMGVGAGGGMVPQMPLDPGGMVKMEGGGAPPTMKLEGGGMVKLEGGSMVPVGGGSAGGLLPLGQQQQQQQQQQAVQQAPAFLQQGAGGLGMQQPLGAGAGLVGTGAYSGMMVTASNGFGTGLLPVGNHQSAALQQQQQQQQQHHMLQAQHAQQAQQAQQQAQQQRAAMQQQAMQQQARQQQAMQQQAMQQQAMQQQAMQLRPGPAADAKPAGTDQQMPALNLEAGQSFDLLGNAFADLDGPMPGSSAASGSDARKQQILKQQRWLLFLRHCARCQLPEGQCQYGRNCTVAKDLWQHLVQCKETTCNYPRCNPSRELLRHHQKCASPNCPVCAPVKQYVSKQRQLVFHRKTANLTPELRQDLLMHLQQNPRAREAFQLKHGVDAQTIFSVLGSGNAAAAAAAAGAPSGVGGLAGISLPPPATAAGLGAGGGGGMAMSAAAAQPALPAMQAALAAVGGQPAAAAGPGAGHVLPIVAGAGTLPYAGMQQQPQAGIAGPALGGYGMEAISAAPKRQRTHVLQENMGTSLLEYLNELQIQTHVNQVLEEAKTNTRGVPKREQTPAFDPFGNGLEAESNCSVCKRARMTFEPPSLYCYGCGQRIKRNQVYYGTPASHEIKGVWCHPCYGEIKTETVPLDGFNIRKAELEKRKNDDEVEEGWVQCDQCEGWVHQICGLFNKGRNDQNRGFLCPFCLRDGLRTGERRIPTERPQAMLSARDLPPCDLSDHLEKRLERALHIERQQRAVMEGRHPSEVRTAEGLTVRVVNNVVKRNDVRSRLYAAVQGEGYPEAFMYKQKVILLFQNVDGVDLCLYCLYMQEYGEDVPPPNRKSVYLSYLDSVKYFQPEDVVAAGRGFALRTLVYHEMLLGYLEYAKARGFESMFIWACPPLAGDDYILYCHPFRQKTPRSDRLREWYHTMLKQAQAEGTVTYVSNMWDTYFEGGRDHRLDRLSITQLPYYDGDYWPGEAENLLASITSEAGQGGKGAAPSIKGSSSRSKPLKGKRAGPASGSPTEEAFRRLGDAIQGMREDFIVVHLQEPCSFCREYMSGGMRYFHPTPPQKVVIKSERTFDGISLDKPGLDGNRTVSYTRFALCSKCYSAEIAGQGKGLPPGMQLNELMPAPNPVIPQCVDTVPETENEFFDTRTAFLSLCQGNHYQFDSLRRAKHSSMMVLYHLHNPTAPAFSCTCNVCNKEIQGGEGWRCGTCADFDMCNTCFLNPAIPRHEHPLVRHARDIDERRNRLSQEQLAARNQALHRTMQVLLHASECTDPKCPSTSCARVKAMYHHAMNCPVKLAGNCQYCRRMWMLLQMHATQCTVPNCQVPRCTQLRTLRRRQATRQEDKRRAAYRTMLRQQMGS